MGRFGIVGRVVMLATVIGLAGCVTNPSATLEGSPPPEEPTRPEAKAESTETPAKPEKPGWPKSPEPSFPLASSNYDVAMQFQRKVEHIKSRIREHLVSKEDRERAAGKNAGGD